MTEQNHGRNGTFLSGGLDHDSYTATFGRRQADERIKNIRLSNDADQPIFTDNGQRPDSVAAKSLRRFFNGTIWGGCDDCSRHDSGNRPRNGIFENFDGKRIEITGETTGDVVFRYDADQATAAAR